MKNVIGFCAEQDQVELPDVRAMEETRPVPSVAEVFFPHSGRTLSYYNDRFDLRENDVVFVSGKLEGKPGLVRSVTTRFKIRLAQYERVVAHARLLISGTFVPAAGMMVSLGADAEPDAETFRSWVQPPRDEEEIACGEGHILSLAHPEQAPGLIENRLQRAIDYCKEGRVRYLRLVGGVGTAFVEGEEWYEVSFTFDGAELRDLYCDCPCPGLCKHELAAAIVLRAVLEELDCLNVPDFTAVEQGFFWNVLRLTRQGVTV